MHLDFKQPGGGMDRYSFFAFHALYRRLMYVIFSASLILAVFAADLRLSACYELAFAAVLALLFNGTLTVFYEASLHNASTYTPLRRLIVIAIGWGTFVMFSTGVIIGIWQLCTRG